MKKEKLLPLHQAILDDDVDAFKKILDETDDIKALINEKDEKGRNAIFYAARNGRLGCFKCILDFGASLDFIDTQTGDTLLHTAFAYSHGHKLIDFLLDECHMDVNAVDGYNRTILGVAMLFADVDEACYLICKGAKNVGDIEHLEVLLKYIPIEIQRLEFKAEYIAQNKKQHKEYQRSIAMLEKFLKDTNTLTSGKQ